MRPALSPFAQLHLLLSALPALIFNGPLSSELHEVLRYTLFVFEPYTCDMNGAILFLRDIIFPRDFSIIDGKASSLRVWPVGAVSNTTTLKSIVLTNLVRKSQLILSRTVQSWVYSFKYLITLPHNFCKAHSFINSWKCPKKLFHHVLTHGHNIYRKAII